MNYKDNKDFLFAIWVFKTLGWSNRRIAKLFTSVCRTNEITIRRLLPIAYAYGDTYKCRSFAKDERVRIRYIGHPNNLENLNAYLHQNPCGGGRRNKPINYNDNWEISKDDE
jgi:hypothetical protein